MVNPRAAMDTGVVPLEFLGRREWFVESFFDRRKARRWARKHGARFRLHRYSFGRRFYVGVMHYDAYKLPDGTVIDRDLYYNQP